MQDPCSKRLQPGEDSSACTVYSINYLHPLTQTQTQITNARMLTHKQNTQIDQIDPWYREKQTEGGEIGEKER